MLPTLPKQDLVSLCRTIKGDTFFRHTNLSLAFDYCNACSLATTWIKIETIKVFANHEK